MLRTLELQLQLQVIFDSIELIHCPKDSGEEGSLAQRSPGIFGAELIPNFLIPDFRFPFIHL